ncbi:MAG: extracellular solute-binding protein [Pikeienuella sp.]
MTRNFKPHFNPIRSFSLGGFTKKLFIFGMMAAFLTIPDSLWAGQNHGLAMHGEPKLSSNFTHLPYTNPNAPKGGTIVFGEVGTFDNLNPFIIKGDYPWEVRVQTFESLLFRSRDEAFTLYGLLAESVETPPDRSWVAFTLSPKARFSDGSPVTVDDVIFSMEVLAEKGQPNFRSGWKNVERIERIGENGVRFHFKQADREAALLLGLRPIFKKTQWDGRNFADTTLTPVIGSGPYVVDQLEAGRSITLRRNEDHWGRGLPVNVGRHNLDEIRIEYFRDGAAMFEAFKAGEISVFRDGDANRWADGYNFPSVVDGKVVKAEVPHQRPTGMRGFVFNTRNPLFADLRVREALTMAFDFEWISKTLLSSAYERIPSYFGNSPLAHSGPLEGAEAALLANAELPAEAVAGPVLQPVSKGDGRNRRNIRKATKLLKQAGWNVVDGSLVNAKGEPFEFEILVRFSANEKIAEIYASALKKLGIQAQVRLVDAAQHQARLVEYDFDMIVHRWALSLSPGAEQYKYWGSAGVTEIGSRNHAGVNDPVVDGLIDQLTGAKTGDELQTAAQALDRVLTAGRYVVPFWFSDRSRIAHDARLHYPAQTPLYGDWPGFMPDVWWWSEAQ